MLGLGLALAGFVLSSTCYIILRSVPLTALGFSTIILGATSLALGKGQPSSEASGLLQEPGSENIAKLIEELGLTSKAVYLPSSLTGGRPQALIPLHTNPHPPKPQSPLPKRFIVKYGPNPEDMGLLITTPGSTIANMSGSEPNPAPADLEATLSSVLTGIIDLADAVKVSTIGEKIIVEVSNPRLKHKSIQAYECLGSPLASIVASIVAEALDKPVIIDRETHEKHKSIIELKPPQ
jgi:hypothetical protein